jgi:hypothetical protein
MDLISCVFDIQTFVITILFMFQTNKKAKDDLNLAA